MRARVSTRAATSTGLAVAAVVCLSLLNYVLCITCASTASDTAHELDIVRQAQDAADAESALTDRGEGRSISKQEQIFKELTDVDEDPNVSIVRHPEDDVEPPVAAGSQAKAPSLLDNARLLCGDKEVYIPTVKAMQRLILVASNSNYMKCRNSYKRSLNELDAILKLPRAHLCEKRYFNLLRSFHFRFISPPKHVDRIPEQYEPLPREIVRGQLHPEPQTYVAPLDAHGQPLLLPLAARHFFLSFMLQLSAQCKRTLLANLATGEPQRLYTDDERANAIMGMLAGADGPLGELVRRQDVPQMRAKQRAMAPTEIDFETALYMPDLEGIPAPWKKKANETPPASKRTFIVAGADTAASSPLMDLVHACRLKFKPIYDEIIIPVIRMSKLGYEYLGDRLSEEEHARLTGDEVKTWLNAVRVCEIFNEIMIVPEQDLDRIEAEADMKEKQLADRSSSNSAESEQQQEEEAPQVLHLDAANAAQLEASAVSRTSMDAKPNADETDDAVSTAEFEEPDEDDDSLALDATTKPPSMLTTQDDEEGLVHYKPSVLDEMSERLWITAEPQLDLELSRKGGGEDPLGWRGAFRKGWNSFKGFFERMDPNRSAHYRRNQVWYSGVLNAISSVSNVASITTTVVVTTATFAG